MSKIILALNSIRGKSGKDTLIEHLEKQLGLKVCRVAFADVLKKQCAEVLGDPRFEAHMHTSAKDTDSVSLSIEKLPEGDYKEFLENHSDHCRTSPRSLRWHLQRYGTEFRREFLKEPDIWLSLGLIEIAKALADPETDVVVVTDLRLPNEYSALTLAGAKTVRIVRDWFIQDVDEATYHVSDIALMAHPFDALVVNSWGKPEEMVGQVKPLLSRGAV
ncbi:hypothetical protein C4K35_1924 [Pseudomonas chlororaphis subsp. piscium]|uniref:hypothetical protein n=1 Tax=Pseudomonas chlororaphis TaxID=587753 RepID=UPI000F576859|nr:hypothetical protein [Pseudomonas chlororaphis]AZC49517.1 hypothetical protein C4K35_1924 [Pseudomonas chlororaphis subsp. piscium]